MEPLPPIPGPRLPQFKGRGGHLDIDFIKYLGSGVHAHVWKVRIDGDVYALKMFRFGDNFTPASFFHVKLTPEEEVLYMHPFNCEARAYARLHEVNEEHLAIPCYGYLLLDQEQQLKLREKDTACEWTKDWYYYDDLHAGRPIQALVKKFIEYDHVGARERGHSSNMRRITRAFDSPSVARKLLNNMATLHRIGILHRDINNSNVADGRFLDFSTSWTKPHPCLDTKQIESVDDPYDQLGITDAYGVDMMIGHWNKYHPPKLQVWFRAAQNKDYLRRLRSYGNKQKDKKNLRSEWIQEYPGRPDLYKWEPEDVVAKQRKSKHDQRRQGRRRKEKAKQIGRHNESN